MNVFTQHITLFFILLISIFKNGICQNQMDSIKLVKKYSWGINNSGSLILGAYIPREILFTPCINFGFNKNVIFAGIDVYSLRRNIYGTQTGYQYHFIKNNKKTHFYLESNLQYIAYYETGSMPQNIFQKQQNDDTGFSKLFLKSKTLINTSGIGYEINLAKILDFNFLLGYGVNWNNSEYLTPIKIYKRKDGNLFNDNLLLKIGVNIKIFEK